MGSRRHRRRRQSLGAGDSAAPAPSRPRRSSAGRPPLRYRQAHSPPSVTDTALLSDETILQAPAASSGNGPASLGADLYCVCQQPWTGEAMICCDTCQQWFHPLCQDISDERYFELFAPAEVLGISAAAAQQRSWQCCGCAVGRTWWRRSREVTSPSLSSPAAGSASSSSSRQSRRRRSSQQRRWASTRRQSPKGFSCGVH